MSHPHSLPDRLAEKLRKIVPVHPTPGTSLYPCQVTLHDDRRIDRVYFVDETEWASFWSGMPTGGIPLIDLGDVVDLNESPSRIPAAFAQRIYQGTNGGMAGALFALAFKDGQRLTFRAGDLHDFIDYPVGYGPRDVIGVDCRLERSSTYEPVPSFMLCLLDTPA